MSEAAPEAWRDFIRQEVEAQRKIDRDFVMDQIDGQRVLLEGMQVQMDRMDGEVTQYRGSFTRLQAEMREGFADLKEIMPSTEMMVEIKQMLQGRRETIAFIKRGIIAALCMTGLTAVWELVKPFVAPTFKAVINLLSFKTGG